jgi:acyl carrier protein
MRSAATAGGVPGSGGDHDRQWRDGSSPGGTGVRADIVQLLSELFSWIDGGGVADDTRLREDLGLDSLHLVELQVSAEDRLHVRFDPLDDGFFEAFETVGGFSRYVWSLRSGWSEDGCPQ